MVDQTKHRYKHYLSCQETDRNSRVDNDDNKGVFYNNFDRSNANREYVPENWCSYNIGCSSNVCVA